MKPSQIERALTVLLEDPQAPVMLVGQPGAGKTDIVKQVATSMGMNLIVFHPAVAEPTDFRGFPWPDIQSKSGEFLPFDQLKQLCDATEPVIAFFDDMGQAANAVQAAVMQLQLARHVGPHELSDEVRFVAATNRSSDRAGVRGLLQPLQNRFAAILEIEIDEDDWSAWAARNHVNAETIAAVRFMPQILTAWKSTNEIKPQPTPRTIAMLSTIIEKKLPEDLETQLVMCSIGEEWGAKVIEFLRKARTGVDLDQILQDPGNFRVPDDMGLIYMVATGLASKATVSTMKAVSKVAHIMERDGRGEMAMLMLRDAVRRNETLCSTPEWTSLMTGPVGDLLKAV